MLYAQEMRLGHIDPGKFVLMHMPAATITKILAHDDARYVTKTEHGERGQDTLVLAWADERQEIEEATPGFLRTAKPGDPIWVNGKPFVFLALEGPIVTARNESEGWAGAFFAGPNVTRGEEGQ